MAEFNEDTTLDDYFEEVKKKKNIRNRKRTKMGAPTVVERIRQHTEDMDAVMEITVATATPKALERIINVLNDDEATAATHTNAAKQIISMHQEYVKRYMQQDKEELQATQQAAQEKTKLEKMVDVVDDFVMPTIELSSGSGKSNLN